MITIATWGGILMCIGAFLSLKGKIYQAVATYLFADACWVWLTFDKGDYQALFFTLIGSLLSLAAFIKMYLGVMRKDLKND
jgi:hypothetical protein